MGAAEGAAGNISVFVRQLHGLDPAFVDRGEFKLPLPCPSLAGGWVVVTSSGRRLRDTQRSPETVIVVLNILPGGMLARRYSAFQMLPTSEINSHLAVHEGHVARRKIEQHAVVHAQPFHLTYLSHHPNYSDTRSLSRRLVRWQPETLFVFPEGIAVLPYELPGSEEQMLATAEAMQNHRMVVWMRHGVLARSDANAVQAANLVEYADAAAHYELENLRLGMPTEGFSDEQILQFCKRFEIDASLFVSTNSIR
jgi:rhamnulose-1-phosphate aldolase